MRKERKVASNLLIRAHKLNLRRSASTMAQAQLHNTEVALSHPVRLHFSDDARTVVDGEFNVHRMGSRIFFAPLRNENLGRDAAWEVFRVDTNSTAIQTDTPNVFELQLSRDNIIMWCLRFQNQEDLDKVKELIENLVNGLALQAQGAANASPPSRSSEEENKTPTPPPGSG